MTEGFQTDADKSAMQANINQMAMQQNQMAMQQNQMMNMQQMSVQQNQMQTMVMQGTRHLTRGEIVNDMSMFATRNTGVVVSKVVKLDEMPNTLRHACTYAGVTELPQYTYQYMSEYGSAITVPFFFCPKCGKLFYDSDYLQ